MKEKIYSMKEAAKLLGVSVRTLQRRHQTGELRCILTPGGRRRIPESEALKLQQKMGLATLTGVEESPLRPEKIERVKPPAVTPLREFLTQEVLDRLSPATLAERMNYLDLLVAAVRLGSFTPEQLSQEVKCLIHLASMFCEKLTTSALATKEGENYRLVVKVI